MIASAVSRSPFGLLDLSAPAKVQPARVLKPETLTVPPVRRWRIPTFRGDMVIEAEAAPSWFEDILRSMVDLLQLDENWDSYGARRIEPSSLLQGLDLLETTMHDDTPLPLVVPAPRGGLQFEWHLQVGLVEVEVLPDNLFSFYSEETGLDAHTSVEGTLTAVRKALSEALSRLSGQPGTL